MYVVETWPPGYCCHTIAALKVNKTHNFVTILKPVSASSNINHNAIKNQKVNYQITYTKCHYTALISSASPSPPSPEP